MGSVTARLQDVNFHALQRNRSTIKVTMHDGETVHGQIVSFDDWHMLMRMDTTPCVVFLRAVTSIEKVREPHH